MKLAAFALCFLAAVLAVPTANPFAGGDYYVNPSFQKELDTSIATATDPTTKANLQKMRNVPSAYWLDVMSKITGNGTDSAEGILADAASKSPAPLVTLIVYDLPNRDCHAKASNGEICCTANADGTCDYNAGGDCADGLNKYKHSYIDPLVTILKKYESQVPIVLIIEPDSLPNLATNQADPHCGNSATTAAYEQGIPYAVKTIGAACPSIAMYLDAAHGGWLGWENNAQKFAQKLQSMDILDKLRGMSTNVANYQPLGIACPTFDYCLPNGGHQSDPCCADPCKLEHQYNPANNEHNYVLELTKYFGADMHFVIDTGRNGVADMRQDCANWCNIRGAGIGMVPTIKTNGTAIDAYYWLKTPGESDGCTQTLPDGSACKRYDSFCGSMDSIGSQSGEPKAPTAGAWFDYQVKMLAKNAHMG